MRAPLLRTAVLFGWALVSAAAVGTAQQDLPGFAAKDEALRLRLCSVMKFDDAGILIDWKDHG